MVAASNIYDGRIEEEPSQSHLLGAKKSGVFGFGEWYYRILPAAFPIWEQCRGVAAESLFIALVWFRTIILCNRPFEARASPYSWVVIPWNRGEFIRLSLQAGIYLKKGGINAISRNDFHHNWMGWNGIQSDFAFQSIVYSVVGLFSAFMSARRESTTKTYHGDSGRLRN